MNFLKNILFRRATLTYLAMLFQLLVLMAVIISFNQYFVFFYGISMVISIVAVLRIMNNKSNPGYKLCLDHTYVDISHFRRLVLCFLCGNKASKRTKRSMKFIGNKTREVLVPESFILDEMAACSQSAANQSGYIQNYANYPPYNNTASEYLPTGEIKFERLKEELRKAEHYIFFGVLYN